MYTLYQIHTAYLLWNRIQIQRMQTIYDLWNAQINFFFPGNVVHLWKHDKEHRQYYIAQSLLFTVPQVGHGIHLRGKRIYAEIKNHRNLHSISTQKSEFLLRDRISIKTILDNKKISCISISLWCKSLRNCECSYQSKIYSFLALQSFFFFQLYIIRRRKFQIVLSGTQWLYIV